jgi:hypothetical protein
VPETHSRSERSSCWKHCRSWMAATAICFKACVTISIAFNLSYQHGVESVLAITRQRLLIGFGCTASTGPGVFFSRHNLHGKEKTCNAEVQSSNALSPAQTLNPARPIDHHCREGKWECCISDWQTTAHAKMVPWTPLVNTDQVGLPKRWASPQMMA